MFKTNYTNEILSVDDNPSFFSDHRIEPAEWPSSYNDYQSDNHSQQNALSEAIDPDVEIKLEAEPPVINQTYLSPFGFFHFQPNINFSHDSASQPQIAKILPATNLFFATEEKHSFRKEKSNENYEKSLASLELLEKKEKKTLKSDERKELQRLKSLDLHASSGKEKSSNLKRWRLEYKNLKKKTVSFEVN